MIHLAMHDAVAGIDGTFNEYAAAPVAALAAASAEEALCSAADRIVRELYPSHAVTIDNAFQTARALLGLGTGPLTPSEKYCVKCAEALILERTGDWSKDTVAYQFQPDPGAHRPDPHSPG